MKTDASTIVSSIDNYELHVYDWTPEDPANTRAAIVVVHGMGEHAYRYSRLAAALTSSGIAVSAADIRGHGKTDPEGTPGRGIFSYSEAAAKAAGKRDAWAVLAEDVRDVVRRTKEKYPDLSVVLFGHSMGSLIVQQVLVDGGDIPATLDGAILSGSCGKPNMFAKAGLYVAHFERFRLGKTGNSKVIDAISTGDWNSHFEPIRTPYDWLSRDKAEVDKYVTDPDCGLLVSIQMWIDIFDNLPRFTGPQAQRNLRRDLPVLIFSGSQDPVGDMGKSVTALANSYKIAGVMSVACKLYEGGRHEMLNEINRGEVMDDMVGWVEEILANKENGKKGSYTQFTKDVGLLQ